MAGPSVCCTTNSSEEVSLPLAGGLAFTKQSLILGTVMKRPSDSHQTEDMHGLWQGQSTEEFELR